MHIYRMTADKRYNLRKDPEIGGGTQRVTLEVVVLAASQSHQDPLWALPPGPGTGHLGDKDTRLRLGRKPARDRIAGHWRSRP